MKILPHTAYCMNLDTRTDRWSIVQKEFEILQKVLPINLERVSAVHDMQRPQVGVTKTVHKIIAIAKELNMPYVLILEDDLHILDTNVISEAFQNVPDNWDLLSGGAYHYLPDKRYNKYWMKMKDFCSLHFFIIRNTVYDKVLNFPIGSDHLDRILGHETRGGRMQMYLIDPMPCQQHPGYSNIRKRQVDDNKRSLPWVQNDKTL